MVGAKKKKQFPCFPAYLPVCLVFHSVVYVFCQHDLFYFYNVLYYFDSSMHEIIYVHYFVKL